MVFGRINGIGILLALALLLSAPLAQARKLDLRQLDPQTVTRLNERAQQHYEQALAWLDMINYNQALQSLNAAVAADPANPHLRFMAVQMAVYLGDTRGGSESIGFYDMALDHLREIAESPQLNANEQARASEYMRTIGRLREIIGERDQARLKHGREIARQYASLIYPVEEEEEDPAATQFGMPGMQGMPGMPGAQRPKQRRNTGPDVMQLYRRPMYSPPTPQPELVQPPASGATSPAGTSSDSGFTLPAGPQVTTPSGPIGTTTDLVGPEPPASEPPTPAPDPMTP